MALQVVPATEWSEADLAQCFTHAFDDYIAGSFPLSAAMLPRFLRRQGADLGLSRCVLHEGRLAGLAFVGAIGCRRRIAGMGVCPWARGHGAARALLQSIIDDARRARASAVELEVFAQNTRALALYRGMGFVDGAPLWGFAHENVPGHGALPRPEASAEPHSLTAEEGADWLLAQERDDLPYQASGRALLGVDAATQVWRLGQALIAFVDAPRDRLLVSLLFDADPAQRDALALVRWMRYRFPQHAVHVPQLMRDDVAARAWREAGFAPLPLHQIQMRLPLPAGAA